MIVQFGIIIPIWIIEIMNTCDACHKSYSSPYNLKKHLTRQPLCRKWSELNPGIKNFIDDKFQLPCDDPKELETKCFICNTVFANVGNLNRHLDTSMICSKWSMYKELKPLETIMSRNYACVNEDFVAPAYSLCHIIWNIYIIDKEWAASPVFPEIVRENNIKYIVAILPDEASYKLAHLDIDHSILIYKDHTATLDEASFECECRKIEMYRKERGNIFIYCNNGYQRSIPFLCYYLMKFHLDEVPSVERAIDLILPQVDRSNYAKMRDSYIENMKVLFPSSWFQDLI